MLYSSFGILAILINVIINYDVFKKHSPDNDSPARKAYRNFLIGIMIYYVTDAFWGVLNENHLTLLNYTDTVIYFAAMAVCVFLWALYVIAYLGDQKRFGVALRWTGCLFLIFELIVIVINFFKPVLFWFDESGAYHAGQARYQTLFIQILMFLGTSGHMLYIAHKSTGKIKMRYRTIGIFGIVMVVFIIVQSFFPLLPFYAIGYMLGTCILHTFVLEDEKADRREELENLIRKGQLQELELGSARYLAYTDSLTGVRNKHAYLEDVFGIEHRIDEKLLEKFALIVFDLNGLKAINDTKGHDAGDEYIKSASRLICQQFKRSPVYRIGGDEFVALLEGEDFENRDALLESFERKIESNMKTGMVVISAGMEVFDPSHDISYRDVFERADKKMYERKHNLKEIEKSLHL